MTLTGTESVEDLRAAVNFQRETIDRLQKKIEKLEAENNRLQLKMERSR